MFELQGTPLELVYRPTLLSWRCWYSRIYSDPFNAYSLHLRILLSH